MAPVPLKTLDDDLQRVIQDFYSLSVAVHDFKGEAPLTSYLKDLFQHLRPLNNPRLPLASTSHLPTGQALTPAQQTSIPPEIIAYVDSGRNPDIYTREFVELVQKSNQFLKGRTEALAAFRDTLAREMASGMPELKDEARRVVEHTGGDPGKVGGFEDEVGVCL
ncbi:MAG: RNA polymerase II mediator complex subunit [Vezdaea aestivalis]|nr:MAG: RNA polymerase II mediator complex subunit [Vezdaea aestivalis]